MRLAWERTDLVRMTLKVDELAALMAGARVASRALAGRPNDTAAALVRVLDAFDAASRSLQRSTDTRRAAVGQ